MRKGWLLGGLVVAGCLAFAGTARAVPTTVVISQVYGGGGNATAPYDHDFVELFNLGATPVNVNGWSIQYHASGTAATAWLVTALPNRVIGPGEYLLIGLGNSGGTVGAPLP